MQQKGNQQVPMHFLRFKNLLNLITHFGKYLPIKIGACQGFGKADSGGG